MANHTATSWGHGQGRQAPDKDNYATGLILLVSAT